jgi:hypothetical protein
MIQGIFNFFILRHKINRLQLRIMLLEIAKMNPFIQVFLMLDLY